MDFSFSEEQEMLRELAREILEKELSPERVKQVEASPDWFDRELWAGLAAANLLGTAIPEEHGGMGFGIEELVILFEELGRTVAPTPAFAALALAALPIAQFGSDEQKRSWLPRIASGETILTAAVVDADSRDPMSPATHARQNGDGWILEGHKRFVPALGIAERVLVPAATGRGVGIFLVDPQLRGVRSEAHRTSTGEPLWELELDDVRVPAGDVLGGEPSDGPARVTWMVLAALSAVNATQVGVSERALELTAKYVSEREQFGQPIGAFQAVQHRLADCFGDLDAMRWSHWRAVWRLAHGLDAGREAAVAKFWAADAGSRIANTAMHVHGGMGVDMDFPIHRYFLWSKFLELSLGSAAPTLAWLGKDMARQGPKEIA